MPIENSGTLGELDICRAGSESKAWQESWRVMGFGLSSSEENISEDSYYAWLFSLLACLLGTGLTLIVLAVSFLGETLYLRDSRV